MAKSVVTLYIDDTSIRLLVAQGKRIQKWAYLPLEPGLVKDSTVADEAGVAAKIQELLKTQKVNAKKVVAGLGGLNSLTRLITLPKLPKAMLDEAIRQEAESIMPVPLEQLYLSWQIIHTSGEEMQAFLAASSRNAVDVLIKTLHQAGLDPYFIDSKPLALARVANKSTAIIVDAQPTELDIVIMVDGIPQPVRSLSLSSKTPTLSDKLPTISEDLEQTIRFYDSSHPEKLLDPSIPIFISGELAQEQEACQSLSNKLNRPVLPLPSPLKCPDGLAPTQYMVNIGLALKELSLPRAEANFSVVNLNFVPVIHKPKPISLTKTLIMPSIIIIAIGALYPLVTRIQDTSAAIASLRVELNNINKLTKQMQTQQQDITDLEKKVGEAEASRDIFTTAVDYIDTHRYQLNGSLDIVMFYLPASIDLETISYAGDAFTMSGMAPSEVEVLSYATKLRDSGSFSRVTISSMEKTEDGMSFGFALTPEG